MSLTISHKDFSADNLQTLLAAKNIKDVTTPLTLQLFEDYKKAKIGFGHQFKKYTASLVAYSATIGLPVAGVVGTTYWLFKDFVKDPTLMANLIWKNEQMIEGGNFFTDSIAPYSTPALALTTLGGALAVDFAAKKALGVAPIRSVSRWTIGMISTALLYAAYKAGEITTSSYQQVEVEKTETRKKTHQQMIKQLTNKYNNIADEFTHCYDTARNSPKKLLEIKNTADELQALVPFFKSQLATLDLKASEIGHIMDKLLTATKNIKEKGLSLRTSGNQDDSRFNFELLSCLAQEEFVSKAVSKQAISHLEIAKANTLGTMHSLKSIAYAGAAGIAAATVVEVAIPALLVAGAYVGSYFSFPSAFDHVSQCSTERNFSHCGLEAGVVALSILPAIAQGVDLAKKIHTSFSKERIVADKKRVDHIGSAYKELLRTYAGVADDLNSRFAVAKKNPKKMEELKINATSIQEKLPIIKNDISKLGVFDHPSEITKQLEIALENVLGKHA